MQTSSSVFVVDPKTASIPNDGVAKVLEPSTPEEWAVLRHEVRTFVCDGEYRAGLERILATFMRGLGEPIQPAVWVSGFYGSGKSHMVRILEILWRDVKFQDGASARGLATLTPEIHDYLRELQTAGNREGGVWSAGGSLAACPDSVRMALMGIVLRGAGLPARYQQARFVLWLKSEGMFDAVQAGVAAAGRDWNYELTNMLVSPVLSKSLLVAYPGFAESESATRQLLKAQFPSVDDVSDDEMLATLEQVLHLVSNKPGKLPLALIVLDELQQYIAENTDRMLRVQNAVESLSTKFGSRVLIVATGQSALQGGSALSKLQGRFTVNVSLSDKDVETVVRQVVLRKKADSHAPLTDMLARCSGEIDRHLAGTKLGPSAADTTEVKAADYPLLPVRRRFWERVLRAVDRAGTAGQLRTQLKVVHEAVREIADRPLGTVVAADRIYGQLAPTLLQNAVLLHEVDETIKKQDDGSPDGLLRMRLCSLIYLIAQLPRESGADTGVRATADTLADLLVEDLVSGGAALRGQIPTLLSAMVTSGELMVVEGEYRLQTRESAEWEKEYRSRLTAYSSDAVRLATDRSAALKVACAALLKDVTLSHGAAKIMRKVELAFASEAPSTDGGVVPVWIRDEWSVPEKTVREDAQAAGSEGPIVYVHLPRRSSDDLAKTLAGLAAATETLGRPTAPTSEALEARQGMTTRKATLQAQLQTLVAAVLKDARVWQGGGAEVVAGDLRASVAEAMKASLQRLYPDFKVGDAEGWDTVKKRVRDGSGDALGAIGYKGDAKDEPACQRVLTYLANASRKGLDIRKRFTGPPFGWGQDAADGAILALAAAGCVRATWNGSPIKAPDIDQGKLGQVEFRSETTTVTATERMAVRAMIIKAKVPCKPGDEAAVLASFVDALKTLAVKAGGQAPLPPRPSTKELDDLAALAGNDAVASAYSQIDALDQMRNAWGAAAKLADERMPRWTLLQRLLKHAAGLEAAAAATSQADAILAHRSLLVEPDPVQPVCTALVDALLAAVNAAKDAYASAYCSRMDALEADATWTALSKAEQAEILAQHDLGPGKPLDISTEARLLEALDATGLAAWSSRTAALPERFSGALLEAAQRIEPEAVMVKPPGAKLSTVDDVDKYLGELRQAILEQIEAGHPVVI